MSANTIRRHDLAYEANAQIYDEVSDSNDGGTGYNDGLVAQHESHDGQPLLIAALYFIMMMLGIGCAFAWHAPPIQSTIRTWPDAAIGAFFVRPTGAAVSTPAATVSQPTTADIARRMDDLSNQIGALKEQINHLNAEQTQSAKSAAEQQAKVLALQQMLDQKTQEAFSKPPQPDTASKEPPPLDTAAKQKREVSAHPKPRPRPPLKPKSEEEKPLSLGPS
jgi:hypothetical protein